MAIALLVGRNDIERKKGAWFVDEWLSAMHAFDSNLDIRVWPDIGNIDEIDFVLVWRHPMGVLSQFTKAKAIASLAAGVDHIMEDSDLPKNIPIVRVLDPYMANDIVQYVLTTVLFYIKRMELWEEHQKEKIWDRKPPFNFSDHTIGVMGLGYLGSKAVNALHSIGLNVIGWSNSPKALGSIKTFTGKEEFNHFLSQTNVLVCMLPLTQETKSILNQKTFSLLRQHAYVINLGRGGHLVDDDLIVALDSGQLSGACLDVFYKEPLPQDHPFWVHPKVRITPHIASVTNAMTAAQQVYDNYLRAMAGEELLNLVDVSKGY